MSADRTPSRWRRGLRFLRPDVPADVDDELHFHLQMRIERNIALGLTPGEARREAIERFGDVSGVRAALVAHDQRAATTRRRVEYGADLVQDVRCGLRALRSAPVFTVAAVLTLALGLGANTAIFSIVDAVLLEPLPYAHPDRLVTIGRGSFGEYAALRERLHTVTDLAAWVPTSQPIDDGRQAIRLDGVAVTPNLMSLLGVAPSIGRGFRPEDGVYGNDHVVLVSDGLWHREFGGASDVVGRMISIDGVPYTVIGVMPPSFRYPSDNVEYWIPYAIASSNLGLMWGVGGKEFIGRLAPGTTLDHARHELRTVWPSLRRMNPEWDPGPEYRLDATVTLLATDVVGASRSLLWMLFGATLLVLLIACVNVANLLLARATARERELAVRAALGGGRGRLVRQLVTEGLLLAIAGAAIGIGIAALAVHGLTATIPTGIPRSHEISMNGVVLAFTLLVSLLTGVVFSAIPAIRATAGGASVGTGFGRRVTAGVSHARVAGALVSGEVALAVMLVVASLLLVRSFAALRSIDPGFDATHVIAARISAPSGTYAPGTGRLSVFYDGVLHRAQALPGMRDAALVDRLPLVAPLPGLAVRVQGRYEDFKHELPFIDHVQMVTPDYFATMRIPIVHGRAFTDQDRADSPPVAIVSRSVARKFWPNGDAIGKRVGYPYDSPWLTIVGIVPDTKQDSLRDTSKATIYMPWSQTTARAGSELWLVARTAGDPHAAGAAIRGIVHDLDRSVPVSDVRTMDAVVSSSVGGSRATAALVTAFALLAVTLGAVGIYGVMSYLVSERRREMGIRIALGASAAGVMRLVLGRALCLAAAGTIAGVICAIVATRALRQWLYGVSPSDPLTLLLVPVLFLGIAALASYLPARRATHADPGMTLREE